MKRVDRYVAREILAPTGVAFLAYTGFMLVRGLLLFSGLVLQSERPLLELAVVLGLSVPHIVVLTIPVSFLLGLLVGVGRLSADSELIALRSAGVDLVRLFRPIGLLAAGLFGVCLAVMMAFVPQANQALYARRLQLSTLAVAQHIQPGVFSRELAGRRIYVEAASPDRTSLRGVIVSDRSDPDAGERLTIAGAGYLESEKDEGRLWLRMTDASTYRVWNEGASDERAGSPEQRLLLVDADPRRRTSLMTYDKQMREQGFLELVERARRGREAPERRLAWVEAHKKLALPFACLVFGLVGLPLGFVNRRGGRAAGFAVSVGIVLFYYVLLSFCEAKAMDGSLSPHLAMWVPNLLLAIVGAWGVVRIRHDRPLLEVPDLSRLRLRRRPAPAGPGDRPSGRRESPRRLLPATFLVDRYVARRFLSLFVLVLTSILTLYLVVDFMEISDDIAKNRPPVSLLVRYGEARLAPVMKDVVPYAFLVAALVAMSGMVRSSETTALLAHGVSLHRSAASLYLLAALSGAGLFFFAERIVPRSAIEAERLRLMILGHPPPPPAGVSPWLRGEAGRFLTVSSVDAESRSVTGLVAVTLDPSTFSVRSRVDAPRARLLPGRGFVVEEGWIRRYGPGGDALRGRLDPGFLVEAPEADRVLLAGRLDPTQMTNLELSRFIRERRRAGADVSALATDLQQRYALALAVLLLTLLGLPYAYRFGKRGAVAGVGIALLIGLAYLAISSITGRLGTSGSMAPLVAAWGPNALFGIWAAWGLLGVRT